MAHDEPAPRKDGASVERTTRERTLPLDRDTFSRYLLQAIKRNNLTYRETARRAQEHLPPGMRISDVSVWSYAHGRSLPRKAAQVEALGRVLGFDAKALLDGALPTASPGPGAPRAPGNTAISVEDLGEGRALLRVSCPLSWTTALEVLRLIGQETSAETVARPVSPRTGDAAPSDRPS